MVSASAHLVIEYCLTESAASFKHAAVAEYRQTVALRVICRGASTTAQGMFSYKSHHIMLLTLPLQITSYRTRRARESATVRVNGPQLILDDVSLCSRLAAS